MVWLPHLHISWRSRRWEGEGVLSLPLSARYRIPWSGYEYSLLETQNVWRREFLWIFLAFQFPKTMLDSHVNFGCAQKRVPRLYLNLWVLVYWRWRMLGSPDPRLHKSKLWHGHLLTILAAYQIPYARTSRSRKSPLGFPAPFRISQEN